jgi:hypothetical protein
VREVLARQVSRSRSIRRILAAAVLLLGGAALSPGQTQPPGCGNIEGDILFSSRKTPALPQTFTVGWPLTLLGKTSLRSQRLT